MAARMRLVGWRVQPVVMSDDGENLTSVDVAPVVIPAANWQAFKDGDDDQALAQVRAKIEGDA